MTTTASTTEPAGAQREPDDWDLANTYRGPHGETGIDEDSHGYHVVCTCGETFTVKGDEDSGLVDDNGRLEAKWMLIRHIAAIARTERAGQPPLPEPGVYADAHAGLWIVHPNGSMVLVGTDTECSWEQGQKYGPFVHYVPADAAGGAR